MRQFSDCRFSERNKKLSLLEHALRLFNQVARFNKLRHPRVPLFCKSLFVVPPVIKGALFASEESGRSVDCGLINGTYFFFRSGQLLTRYFRREFMWDVRTDRS